MSIVFPCEVIISGEIANATIGQDAVITLDYGETADRKVVLDQSIYIKKSDDTTLTHLFDAGLNITNSAMNGVNIDDTTNKTSLGSDTLDFTNADGSILYTRLQQLNLQFTATNKNTNYGIDSVDFQDVSGESALTRTFLSKTSLVFNDASGNPITTVGSTITTPNITTPSIKPTNITDTASSTGTNGQVLTKQTGGITWSPNFPNIATYKQSWASTSVTITAANTLLYTSTAIPVGTATATFLITFQMTAQSSGNHSMIATIGRGTVTPATDQAYNLAKPGANNLTAAINPFGSNLGVFGGGQPVSTSTISFTDTPGNTGTYYYSIWCWATQNNATSQWSNFNVIQIKP